MAIDTNSLVYLIDPFWQGEGVNGKPLVGGYMTVFYAGTDLKYITYQNFDGTENPFKIPLGADGRATILVEAQYTYDCYLYDSFGNLAASRLNVKPNIGGGNISIKGRTYHGVEPVVVNNQYNLISARNIPLGVQEPLHFVEDSESACIIGVSGLQPSGDYVLRPELSSYATEDWVNSQSYMHEYMASAFYPMESNPSGYLTEHQSLDGYMEASKLETADGKITAYNGTAFAGGGSVDPSEFIPWSASGNFATSGDLNDKLDTTAFSTVSGDFLTAIPDTYASKDFVSSSVSSKLDSTAFSTVSGDFITALPEGLLNESGFEYDGDKISAYNGSAFVGQGGGITGEYELSAGNGISIDNYPIEQKTVISVTGNYATEDWVTGQGYLTAETDWTDTITAASANAYNEATAAIPAPFDPSYLSGQIDTKLDSAIYAEDSGKFLTAHQSLADYQTTAGMTAYQPVGDYLTTGDSANFYPSDNPSAFITGVDLTPYQTVEGMTAYQPVGDYLTADALDSVSGDWNEVSAKLDTTAFSDVSGTFLTAHQDISNKLDTTAFSDVSGSFLTAVPDTYLQNTDLSTEDGKVTAISGIPLSAGGDVPEGVMVESGLEYNAVNEISAYNGSAIAQYGAEKQWLVHDDTLVHASNSAQYALGVNLSAVAQLLGIDETVLYSGSPSWKDKVSLSESPLNFSRIKVLFGNNLEQTATLEKLMGYTEFVPFAQNNYLYMDGVLRGNSREWHAVSLWSGISGTNWKTVSGQIYGLGATTANANNSYCSPYLILGIGRKEV